MEVKANILVNISSVSAKWRLLLRTVFESFLTTAFTMVRCCTTSFSTMLKVLDIQDTTSVMFEN